MIRRRVKRSPASERRRRRIAALKRLRVGEVFCSDHAIAVRSLLSELHGEGRGRVEMGRRRLPLRLAILPGLETVGTVLVMAATTNRSRWLVTIEGRDARGAGPVFRTAILTTAEVREWTGVDLDAWELAG